MNGRVYDPSLARFMSADPNIQAPGNGQSFNRYSYVLNNPLSYTDPSGYSWWTKFRDNVLKPVVVIAVAIYAAPFASAYAGVMTGSSIAAGAAAGATIGATAGLVYNGPQGMVKGAVTGGVTGGIFGGVDAQFGDQWSWDRVGANSVAGGVNSTLQGGKFGDGFKTSFLTSSAKYGWDYTRQATDGLKVQACNSGGGSCLYDERGQIRTDGARDVDWSLNPNKEGNWLTRSGMELEGSGQHWYDPGGALDNKYLRYFVTDVSKVHDWFNSWSYNTANGFYMSRGTGFDSIFQAYSFAGMPVAGALTAVSYLGEASGQVVVDSLSRRQR